MIKVIILIFLGQISLALTPLDKALGQLIKEHGLSALPKANKQNRNEVILGSRLFSEVRLSGNKDITCMHCHHPRLGTGDDLPFSIGTGGAGLGTSRVQDGKGKIIKRHAPALINLGYDDIKDMFWDGRIHVDWSKNKFKTPSKELNHNKTVHTKIRSSLAAQVIFPLLSPEEMLGTGNEISNKEGDFGKWNALIFRLLNGSKSALYQNLFSLAYPEDYAQGNISIAHVANALAAFITRQFNLVNTPYDQYLAGDADAMSEGEKRGLKIFLDKGACVDCHNGRHLTDWGYKSIGLPQIGPVSSMSTLNDRGRYEVTGLTKDMFNYRTPPLRNIELSAPYMHNGAYATLEEVVEHYNHTRPAIKNYVVSEAIQGLYEEKIIKDQNTFNNKHRFQLISNDKIREGLNLSDDEKSDLVQFLRTGLSTRRLQRLKETQQISK